MPGYSDPKYAQSLKEFGAPRELSRCGGWLLQRQIHGTPHTDAMGCYPLFSCLNWSELKDDLDDLGESLVSVSMVTDPFGDFDEVYLRHCFKDVVVPFKHHFIIDLSRSASEIGSSRRRKYAKKALSKLDIEVHQGEELRLYLPDWIKLYGCLAKRHRIEGIRAFSEQAFATQFEIPGMVMLRAVHHYDTIGAQFYLLDGDVAHCHLGATNDIGYEMGCIHALDWYSVQHFSGQVRWINLGGGVGIGGSETDGLSQYKRGWSTNTRPTYFCGRILNPSLYAEISPLEIRSSESYFPCYRSGEFA